MIETQQVTSINHFDKTQLNNVSPRLNTTTQAGSSVLNTFLMNHERKKESQTGNKPDYTKERQTSLTPNAQSYCSVYARKKAEDDNR